MKKIAIFVGSSVLLGAALCVGFCILLGELSDLNYNDEFCYL